ncbi:hypothetical protein FV296_27065, partial [Escherichia coli]
GVLSPTLILSVRVQVLILNSPGGTRHHAMAHSATLQPLSGGAFLWTKKARAGRRGRQGINNKT